MWKGKSALFYPYAIDSILPALLKSRATRFIGSEVNTNAGIVS
jgi:hypothetical protein